MKTLLSLFDYSMNWSRPFALGGWNVILWDVKHTQDMYLTFSQIEQATAEFFHENIFDNYGTVDGVIAAVPCTEFAASGARWWKQKDADGRTEKALEMVYQTLRIIDLCQGSDPEYYEEPENSFFWAIENPVGRLNRLVPDLAEFGPRYFQPYQFGHPYTKKTGLWGEFVMPEPTNVVEPIEGSMMHSRYGGKSERTKELRSLTPEGFAQAFYEANS